MKNKAKEIGLYIHIPFCKRKCYYCDFISFTNTKEEEIKEYIQAIKCEIIEQKLEQYNIKTIYIGGGTPSLIDSSYIEEILNILDLNKAKEITIEINPGTVNKQKLENYYRLGINRLSIGLQSTDNNLLKKIGRIHTYENFLETYELAREVGFKNINVDLMLALPNQTIEILTESIEKIIMLNPEHISVYSLILEENTVLWNLVNSSAQLISDETEREMYWLVTEKLKEAGYEHYEISNYSKLKYKSKHNSDCWDQKEYIGIGAAAHSFLDNIRYSNAETLEEYTKKQNKKTIQETLNQTTKMQEYIILKLRTIKGIEFAEFEKKFSVRLETIFQKEIAKLFKNKLLEIDQEQKNIRLTKKGIDLANQVWQEFV